MSVENNSNLPAGNTGLVPPVSNNNSMESLNIGTGESVATAEPIATAEALPNENTSVVANSPNTNNAPPLETPVANTTVTKSGIKLSAKQSDLQRLRAETLEDMRAAYSERFSDTSKYPKPPKAKAYHASGLTTIRQRDGEAAYKSALKIIMDKNDPALGQNGRSQLSMTRKKPSTVKSLYTNTAPLNNSVAANSARRNNTVAANSVMRNNSALNRGSAAIVKQSIESMGNTAKGLIDSMIEASKSLTQELAKSNNASALTRISNASALRNTVKPKRTRARRTTQKTALSSIPEEGSTNFTESTM